ncbi:MAG TPA: NAD-dependent epimerase/dehydratase family protein [Bryobacteraceae bacterium]|jgi:UDP-glucose 4-epimerase|nr:NAD-dependent epimerase/dehydratase family protein [Bryobacteraceae bacterium]
MSVLVTGAAGFIGSHLASALLEQSEPVVVLDDLSGGYRRNIPQGAVFQEGSILDEALLEQLFRDHRFRTVCHAAAYAAEGLSHYIRRFNYTNNLIGSVNLINSAVRHEVRCFVFTSSIAVYGSGQLPLTEETIPAPEDPYGIAKRAVELDLEAAHRLFGLNYLVLRPHNVYGERQNIGDRYRNVIGIFMNQILRGEPMTIFGDGLQTRNFTYIGDVAPVIARAVQLPEIRNRVYNIGSSEATTIQDLAHLVAESMGVQPRIRYLPERSEVKHAVASHDRIAAELGYAPKTPLKEGLARMAAWVRQEGSRSTPPFQGIEIEKNLPPVWREARGTA